MYRPQTRIPTGNIVCSKEANIRFHCTLQRTVSNYCDAHRLMYRTIGQPQMEPWIVTGWSAIGRFAMDPDQAEANYSKPSPIPRVWQHSTNTLSDFSKIVSPLKQFLKKNVTWTRRCRKSLKKWRIVWRRSLFWYVLILTDHWYYRLLLLTKGWGAA